MLTPKDAILFKIVRTCTMTPKAAILFKIVHTCAKECLILKYKYVQNPWLNGAWRVEMEVILSLVQPTHTPPSWTPMHIAVQIIFHFSGCSERGSFFLLIHNTSYLSTPLVPPFKYFLLNEVFDVFKKESTINQTRNSAIFYSRLKDNQEWTHFYVNFLFSLNRQPRVNSFLQHALVKQTTLLLKYQQVKHPAKHWHSFGLFLVFWNWVSLRINYYNTFSTLIAWLDNSTNHVNLKTL